MELVLPLSPAIAGTKAQVHDDETLWLSRAKRGEVAALDALMNAHRGRILNLAFQILRDESEAEDAAQEAFVRAFHKLSSFREKSGFGTWLYRVALNTAIAWTRKELRHQRGKEPLEGVADLLTTGTSAKPDPRLEWLYQQIARLKEIDRSVALLLLDGFSYKEIANITGLTESNVDVKINRIKSALAGKRLEGNAS